MIVRMVELDGKPQAKVRVGFAGPILAAREVNAQERTLGSASVEGGALVTSFSAFQPRSFALTLAASATRLPRVRSTPVTLHYDLATASADGAPSAGGFDAAGNALPAEMLPAQMRYNDVQFQLAPAKTGSPNALVARGQTIELPAGEYRRAYLLAASSDGDQLASFEVGGATVKLNIEDWGGFIGQWDDRQWTSTDTSKDDYGQMRGVKRGYIKRADLAWYSSHHHDAAGRNVPYRYAYLFAYPIQLPPGTKRIKLPDNTKLRILAVSVSDEAAPVIPVQPLYDVLPPSEHGG